MKHTTRALLLAISVAGLAGSGALPAAGAELSNSEFVIVPEDDVLADDLYAGAVRVVIDGTLDGDLVAAAAEDVVINGVVTGSVTAIAPRVVVAGEIQGTLRVVTNRLEVRGITSGDVIGVSTRASFPEGSLVGGDVVLYSWSAAAAGSFEGDLTGSFRNLEVAGAVAGDVDVSVDRLTVTDMLTVGGDFGYRSRNDADGLELADVTGAIVEKTPLPPNLRIRALRLLGRLMIVLFLTLFALLAFYGWPDRGKKAVDKVTVSPVRNWLRGAAVVFAPVLAIGVMALLLALAPAAAAFPLLAVLVPLTLALTGLSFAVSLVAGAPVVGRIGKALFKRLDVYGSLAAGSAVTGLAWLLPWIGWVLPVVVLPLGLGAWISAFRD
jgi:cytoskeletal protein CcmA (bactofilin family)